MLISFAKDHQEHEEQIDDIHVQIKGGEGVIIDGELILLVLPAYDQLYVVNYIQAEYQCTAATVDFLESVAVGAKQPEDETEYHQDEDCGEEIPSDAGEIDGCLHGEYPIW